MRKSQKSSSKPRGATVIVTVINSDGKAVQSYTLEEIYIAQATNQKGPLGTSFVIKGIDKSDRATKHCKMIRKLRMGNK